MSTTRIVTLFGEEITPEQQKPAAAKGRAKKKDQDAQEEDGNAEEQPSGEAMAEEQGNVPQDIEANASPVAEEPTPPVAEHTQQEEAPTANDTVAAVTETEKTTTIPAVTEDRATPHPVPDRRKLLAAIRQTEPKAAKPVPAKPNVAAPVAAEPEASGPETEARIVDPVAVEFKATTPEVEPEVVKPVAAEFETVAPASELELTEPVIMAPEIEEPTTEPELAEPLAVEPEKAATPAKEPRKPKAPKEPEEQKEAPAIIPEDWSGDKKYYTIGEVATLFSVKTSHIRFWTNEFKLKVRTTRKGDRLFTPEQVKELRAIYHLVKERGFTLTGAKTKLKTQNRRDITTIDLKDSLMALREKLQILRDQL